MSREETIDRIVAELHRLPEPFITNLHQVIRMLREQHEAEGAQPDTPTAPWVDEVERVKEQTRNVPGQTSDDQYFT